ncbi:hypothetical protein [Streptomyces sp. NPDC056660]|uniref:hypothetical protein n=1 Tax=Streptomyces sp. NPDC056660 TaxID=3345897 RepID=UPI003678951F
MTLRRRHRITAVAAAVALTATLAAGCEFDDSPDCLSNADTIADSVTAINKAGVDAIEDPTRTQESIDTIEKSLDKINDEINDKTDDKTDDNKLDAAVDDLNRAVATPRRSGRRCGGSSGNGRPPRLASRRDSAWTGPWWTGRRDVRRLTGRHLLRSWPVINPASHGPRTD